MNEKSLSITHKRKMVVHQENDSLQNQCREQKKVPNLKRKTERNTNHESLTTTQLLKMHNLIHCKQLRHRLTYKNAKCCWLRNGFKISYYKDHCQELERIKAVSTFPSRNDRKGLSTDQHVTNDRDAQINFETSSAQYDTNFDSNETTIEGSFNCVADNDDYVMNEDCFLRSILFSKRSNSAVLSQPNQVNQYQVNNQKRGVGSWLSHNVNQMKSYYLKQKAKRKISRALLVLRAESSHRLREEKDRQKRETQELNNLTFSKEYTNNSFEKKESVRNLIGPIGMALFSPLHPVSLFDENILDRDCVNTDLQQETKYTYDCTDDNNDDDNLSVDSFSSDCISTIRLEPEPESALLNSPYILSNAEMNQIYKHLPPIVKLMNWERTYSATRDGDIFETMLRKVGSYRYTLLVIKTLNGDILGGFADGNWADTSRSGCTDYFGGGMTFLYHFLKNDKVSHLQSEEINQGSKELEKNYDSNTEKILKVYKWTGKNAYNQMCDKQKGKLAMGGGGSFGLVVGEWFTRGFTSKCETFGNPPLLNEENFDIWEFEVYGFRQFGF